MSPHKDRSAIIIFVASSLEDILLIWWHFPFLPKLSDVWVVKQTSTSLKTATQRTTVGTRKPICCFCLFIYQTFVLIISCWEKKEKKSMNHLLSELRLLWGCWWRFAHNYFNQDVWFHNRHCLISWTSESLYKENWFGLTLSQPLSSRPLVD